MYNTQKDDSLGSEKDLCQFADDIFLKELVPKGPIDNTTGSNNGLVPNRQANTWGNVDQYTEVYNMCHLTSMNLLSSL